MKPLGATAAALALALLWVSPTLADDAQQDQEGAAATSEETNADTANDDQKDPEAVIDEITSEENVVTGPSGNTEASTGEATPVENWFGCPPKDSENGAELPEHCLDESSDAQNSDQQSTQ